jgi:hypothetical protein
MWESKLSALDFSVAFTQQRTSQRMDLLAQHHRHASSVDHGLCRVKKYGLNMLGEAYNIMISPQKADAT